jgi:hypothetical protein
MGRWAQSRRRGGAREFGILLPPGAGDWTFAGGNPGELVTTRVVDYPAGAVQWQARLRRVGTSVWFYEDPISGGAYHSGGHPSGETWECQIAWWSAAARVSPWGGSKTAVVPPPP